MILNTVICHQIVCPLFKKNRFFNFTTTIPVKINIFYSFLRSAKQLKIINSC
jgi:hypothetical protein